MLFVTIGIRWDRLRSGASLIPVWSEEAGCGRILTCRSATPLLDHWQQVRKKSRWQAPRSGRSSQQYAATRTRRTRVLSCCGRKPRRKQARRQRGRNGNSWMPVAYPPSGFGCRRPGPTAFFCSSTVAAITAAPRKRRDRWPPGSRARPLPPSSPSTTAWLPRILSPRRLTTPAPATGGSYPLVLQPSRSSSAVSRPGAV